MAFSDSMLLFELAIEDLKSYVECKDFLIKSQFADVFSLDLKNPKDLTPVVQNNLNKKKIKRKSKIKHFLPIDKIALQHKVLAGQTVLLVNNINELISNMEKFPIELSFWSKENPQYKIGTTHIPWNYQYIDYIKKLYKNYKPGSVLLHGYYNVFDEVTSKRIATIKLSIKLSYLKHENTTQSRSLSKNNKDNYNTNFNYKPTILSAIKRSCKNTENFETGIKINSLNNNHEKITTRIFKIIDSKEKTKLKEPGTKIVNDDNISINSCESANKKCINTICTNMSLVKSDTVLDQYQRKELRKSKSSSEVKYLNTLNYIFGDNTGPYGKQVYCVGYFTVEKDLKSSSASIKGQSSEKLDDLKAGYKIKLCDSDNQSKKETSCSCSHSYCSLDLPIKDAQFIKVTKCQKIDCDGKVNKESIKDERILLDMSSMQKECCDITQAVEEVVGGMKAKMKFGEDPCFCTCECRFGFTKKTTYCKVCGGYEKTGDDTVKKLGQESFPCPIYHKLVDKNKLKTWSTSGSDSKKRNEDSQKNFKSPSKSPTEKRPIISEKSAESEKDSKKGKKKKKDDRFKFNYGYQAPQIGHGHCAMPCTGTLGIVPKNMGWLWTAEDVPGIKFRPMWKPGATNKHVVRLLRMAKNPDVLISKKRKKEARLKKRSLKRPLLIVHKKNGEYIVTMETMKTYTRPRTFNQYPYEDKPVLTYTVGRTDEENRERQKKKEREQRRLERAQREFIQNAFTDICQEICLKTYQQALGILTDAENPECLCHPAHTDGDKTTVDVSCSCSEEKSSTGSDTDSDEWVVEFTPPNATFDPTFKSKKIIKTDNTSQYSYLDYRVKLLDRFGNPVPRYFKGPDGKQQCSDLGGFWSPDHNWLEINIDGYIAPDGRWAPNGFIGPNGEQVDVETGKFQTSNGKWLVVGIDGYIDSQSRWRFYQKPRGTIPQKNRRQIGVKEQKGGAGDKQYDKSYKGSEATWSCFSDASPKQLSRMGIIGPGPDKRLLLSKLQDMLARGEDVRIPEPPLVPHFQLPGNDKTKRVVPLTGFSRGFQNNRIKCRHPVPSEKGVVAVDDHGNKTYFKLKEYKNLSPKERIANLTDQGISLSSFHVPCFHSFINTEYMKQQQRERLVAADTSKIVHTQTG
ncbi:uncharacterized protein LOC131840996 isoform X2 [Achroia grisella]|uniref:uncharacterized protein LOC131840996 isoform X2 n=1 Tax=Achroia grisella TaxID=688607 RepID=UPI0027D2AB85|nr:uncharacterized protein LOC131840996 isoform X2 [Achroia grisella]